MTFNHHELLTAVMQGLVLSSLSLAKNWKDTLSLWGDCLSNPDLSDTEHISSLIRMAEVLWVDSPLLHLLSLNCQIQLLILVIPLQ